MKRFAIGVVLWGLASLAAGGARADGGAWYSRGPTYVGASAEMMNGLAGASEFGFALQVAPLPFLELEAGMLRHEVDGDYFTMGSDRDTWVYTGTVRLKLQLGYYAIFFGVGVMSGDHAVQNGCISTGAINFCGDENNTLVYRAYLPAWWVRPEFGGEVGFGPFALRMAMGPLILLSDPDRINGCGMCSDGSSGFLFTVGLHARVHTPALRFR